MKATRTGLLAAPVLAAALSMAAPHSAQAQGMGDGWQFEASIYGWFPAISGTTSFPPNGGGPNIDVSMGDVIDALKFAFMGSFEARNGQWGLWTDLVYADFGASKNASRDFTIGNAQLPAGVDANLQLDIKSWIWTLAGVYGLKNDAEANVDLLFGARLLDMTNDLGWTFNSNVGIVNPPPRTGTAQASLSNWDAIVGLKGRAFIGAERTWFVPYYVDVGAGESKLTWQVNAGVGYQFGWGAVIATWRYLDYDFKDSAKIQSASFNGPTIGMAFKF
jgi:hypothetical protein